MYRNLNTRTTLHGPMMTLKYWSNNLRNCKIEYYLISSGTNTSHLSSVNLTCTNSTKSIRSQKREVGCISRMSSFRETICTYKLNTEKKWSRLKEPTMGKKNRKNKWVTKRWNQISIPSKNKVWCRTWTVIDLKHKRNLRKFNIFFKELYRKISH